VALLLIALAISAFVPEVRLSVGSHTDRVAVATATTLLAALAAVLFFGRFWQHQQLRALLIACALGFIAISSLCADVLLSNHVELMDHLSSWIGLGGRVIGWLLIAIAAIVPSDALAREDWRVLFGEDSKRGVARRPVPSEHTRAPGSAAARGKALSEVVIACMAMLIVGIGAYVRFSDPVNHGALRDSAASLGALIAIALLGSLAAGAFLRERRLHPSAAVRLLTLAALLGATSSVAYCASFSMPNVGMGDVLRLSSVIVLLLSVCVEWSQDERRMRVSALMQERRRIAADVHDLIMQDLSLALGTARSIADDPLQTPQASAVVAAGERALAGARQVVDGLIRQDEKPIVEAVELAARAAARHVRLSFDAANVPADTHPDQPTFDSLIHVAREAVRNATKHSHADAVEVVLEREDEWRLIVRDDGRGFDPRHSGDSAHTGGMGFGLQSMRERSEALGGSLHVTSTPGGGTTVEAVLP
jgi:signal transduction histidine kinase